MNRSSYRAPYRSLICFDRSMRTVLDCIFDRSISNITIIKTSTTWFMPHRLTAITVADQLAGKRGRVGENSISPPRRCMRVCPLQCSWIHLSLGAKQIGKIVPAACIKLSTLPSFWPKNIGTFGRKWYKKHWCPYLVSLSVVSVIKLHLRANDIMLKMVR